MRELRPEVEAIIESGVVQVYTTLDITLPGAGGAEPHWSTGEIPLNHYGVERQYDAVLDPEGGDLEMGLLGDADGMDIKSTNVDPALGQTLTGAENPLTGNTGVIGAIFLNPDAAFASGLHYLDTRMRIEVVLASINESTVDFGLFSVLDSTTIGGRLISAEFPWREPLTAIPPRNPDDLPPGLRPRYPDPDDPIGDIGPRRPGRDIDTPFERDAL